MRCGLRKFIVQLNDKYLNILFSLSLPVLSMAFFLFVGADGYFLCADSPSYIEFHKYAEGVMPIYPLFLFGNRLLFGETLYLDAVNVEQALFASVCVLIFVLLIRKKFELRYWESYCVFLLALLPFTVDLPEAMATQRIATEGIAYAAFYLFMALLLKAVWTKHIRWIGLLIGMTLLLAATRSQMQMLFGVCGIIFLYVVMTGQQFKALRETRKKKWVLRLLIGLVGCILISLVGVWCTGRISTSYQKMVKWNRDRLMAKVQGPQIENTVQIEETTDNSPAKRPNVDVTNQYITLIFSKGMYEADYEDYLLFEDTRLRDLFLVFYQVVDEDQGRYVFAHPGLWMWQDVVNGVGKMGSLCHEPQIRFYQGIPEIYNSDEYSAIRNGDQLQIGLTLVKAHFGRVLYHTLLLLPQAFIFTVFFKIEEIYVLCHLITLFLYVSAFGLMIWAYKDKKIDRAYGEFMASVLGVNIFMVLVISLIFFGHQRYVVYNFGIFYIIYFLLLLQLWKVYGKNWLFSWYRKRKS